VDNIGLFVVVSLAVIFVTPYLYMHISARRAVGKSVPIDDLLAESHASHDKTVYFYFMSRIQNWQKNFMSMAHRHSWQFMMD
jgi:hypothetical protein